MAIAISTTIDITVEPVNELPDAVDDPNEMTDEDTPVNIDALANDDFGGDYYRVWAPSR
ncbi:MAG: hypothetical protein H6559_32450 [Lewinellaceae bacterium]|nr:hypothetical protein [Lewinellaceae bacterium]